MVDGGVRIAVLSVLMGRKFGKSKKGVLMLRRGCFDVPVQSSQVSELCDVSARVH